MVNVVLPCFKSTYLPLYRIEFFSACSFSRISSIRLNFALMKMSLVTTNSPPMHSNIHLAVCFALFPSPCAALSTWFVSLLLLIMKTIRPILHSSSVFLLSRCGMSTLNSLPKRHPPLRIIDRRLTAGRRHEQHTSFVSRRFAISTHLLALRRAVGHYLISSRDTFTVRASHILYRSLSCLISINS